MLARPERAPPPPPKLSAPVRRKLGFQWEPFSHLAREITPLFAAHWREIALNQDDIPLDPDFDRYLQCELAGLLHVLTARDAKTARLVGYVFAFIGPHLHYVSTRWCMGDMFYLQPEYRVGWNGVRLVKAFEAGAAARGAKIIHLVEKLHFIESHRHGLKVGSLLEFLGYSPIEQTYAKRIG